MILRRLIRRHALAAGVLGVLTCALLFPVLRSITSAVPGWAGDNLFYVRSMWWMKHALITLHRSPFFDPTAYAPIGRELARGEMTPANTVLGLPITIAFGPITAYNCVVLASFVMTGLGAYAWGTHLTGRRSAGLLAGTIAAFLPYRFAHLPGHLPLLTMQGLPWTLLFFERFVARRTLGRAVALGVALASVVWGSWYYAYSLAMVLPVYALIRTWRLGAVWREAAWWKGLATAGVVTTVLVLPFLLAMLKLSDAGQIQRSFREMESYSIDAGSFFEPNWLNPVAAHFSSNPEGITPAALVEREVALGYVACLLAIVGLIASWRRVAVRALLGLWIVSYLIALGPTLHLGGQQVMVTLPAGMFNAVTGWFEEATAMGPQRDSYRDRHAVPVPLPASFLFHRMPMASGMRVMSRFGVWTGLATAGLATFGALALIGWVERRTSRRAAGWLLAVLIAAVTAESASAFEMVHLEARPVDTWLAALPPGVVVTELPVSVATAPMQDYYATLHRTSTVFGWIGDSYAPPALAERVRALRRFPRNPAIAALRSYGVDYILLTPSAIPDWTDWEARLANTPEFQFERWIGDVRVYRFAR